MTRPQREAYARASVTVAGFELAAGVEWRDGEDPWPLSRRLREILQDTNSASPSGRVRAAEALVIHEWPDRAYFIELGNDEEWVQVFQPYGIPKNKAKGGRR